VQCSAVQCSEAAWAGAGLIIMLIITRATYCIYLFPFVSSAHDLYQKAGGAGSPRRCTVRARRRTWMLCAYFLGPRTEFSCSSAATKMEYR
jgi:hypothetical protein